MMISRKRGRIRVLIDDSERRRRDTLVRLLTAAGADAVAAGTRLRTILRQTMSADIVQRTVFIECDQTKTMRIFRWARLMRKRTVRYWVGSDVYFALTNERVRIMAKRINRLTHANIVVAPHLKDELAELGIESVYIPYPLEGLASMSLSPLPSKACVVCYCVPAKREFYGLDMVLEIARRMGDVRFQVVGDSGDGVRMPPNVHFLGIADNMDKVYEESSVLLRIVRHDGLSRMVLEALSRGRNVVYNYLFPHCLLARDVDESVVALSKAFAAGVNVTGAQYVRNEYADDRQSRALLSFYENLRAAGRRAMRTSGS